MKRSAIVLLVLMLGACAGHRPAVPEGVRQAERYMGLGVQAFTNDDYANAGAMFAKAQAVYRSMDDLRGMVQSGINLAETAIAVGAWDRAQRQVDAVEPLAQRTGRPELIDRVALLAAVALDGRKQREQALARLQPLLPEFGGDDAPRTTPGAEALSAIVLRTRMAFADQEAGAASLWTRRLEHSVAKAGGDNGVTAARLLRFQAELARRGGDMAAARDRLEQALALYRARASRGGTAATLADLGVVAMDEGRADEAREYLERALFIQMWILDRPGANDSLEALARIYDKLGEGAKAAETRKWADSLAQQADPNWKQMREQLAPAD